MSKLVLSIFPGIDLLGRAFEDVFGAEICLVRGPDPIFGGDIRNFHPPAGVFWGVIGGDPCQFHSPLSRMVVASHGADSLAEDMTPEFVRVVSEVQPTWFVRENSPFAYDPVVQGFEVSKLALNNRWVGGIQARKRCFWFGTKDGRKLLVDVVLFETPEYEQAVTSSVRAVCIRMGGNGKVKKTWARDQKPRSVEDMLRLQDHPIDLLTNAPFTLQGKRQVIANGVPLSMGRAIAKAVKRALEV